MPPTAKKQTNAEAQQQTEDTQAKAINAFVMQYSHKIPSVFYVV